MRAFVKVCKIGSLWILIPCEHSQTLSTFSKFSHWAKIWNLSEHFVHARTPGVGYIQNWAFSAQNRILWIEFDFFDELGQSACCVLAELAIFFPNENRTSNISVRVSILLSTEPACLELAVESEQQKIIAMNENFQEKVSYTWNRGAMKNRNLSRQSTIWSFWKASPEVQHQPKSWHPFCVTRLRILWKWDVVLLSVSPTKQNVCASNLCTRKSRPVLPIVGNARN